MRQSAPQLIIGHGPRARRSVAGGGTTLLVAAMVAVLPGLIGVFAAPISLSGGDAREFGQGVQELAVCDSEIFIEVTHVWDADVAGFVVEALEMSGIDVGACAGRRLRVAVWNELGDQVDVCGDPSVCTPDGFSFDVTIDTEESFTLPVVEGVVPDDIASVAVTTTS